MALREWVKLPTAWIQDRGLQQLRWNSGQGADNVAALMLLVVIAHRADEESGVSKLTYDELGTSTSLSRAKIAAGLEVLGRLEIVEREPLGRSTYRLMNYDKMAGWGKLPTKNLYSNEKIVAFTDFWLRRPVELTALKLYLLFVARRDNKMNMANISYEKIEEYTGRGL